MSQANLWWPQAKAILPPRKKPFMSPPWVGPPRNLAVLLRNHLLRDFTRWAIHPLIAHPDNTHPITRPHITPPFITRIILTHTLSCTHSWLFFFTQPTWKPSSKPIENKHGDKDVKDLIKVDFSYGSFHNDDFMQPSPQTDILVVKQLVNGVGKRAGNWKENFEAAFIPATAKVWHTLSIPFNMTYFIVHSFTPPSHLLNHSSYVPLITRCWVSPNTALPLPP